MDIINELLVKFKHINDGNNYNYISCTTYKGKVVDVLPILKQVDSIKLKDDWYVYCSSEFEPSGGNGFLDVLYIYVDDYDD